MVHNRHRRRRGSRKNLIIDSLENVGSAVQTVAIKSTPKVKKGLYNLFGLLSKGVNTGVQGVRSFTRRHRRRFKGTRRR